MAHRAHFERRGGWWAAFDPRLWRQAFTVGTAGAVSMAVLACAVALARHTTGHDWYAAARITVADFLIAAGFDEDATVEYRTAEGATETLSRYGLGSASRHSKASESTFGKSGNASPSGTKTRSAASNGPARRSLGPLCRNGKSRREYPGTGRQSASRPLAKRISKWTSASDGS